MSYSPLKQDPLFYQRFLKSNGYYTGKLDGIWGPKSNAAEEAFLDDSEQIKNQYGSFHVRSESNIITLVPVAQIQARKLLKAAAELGKDVRIISGTRSYEEQNALFRQGRYGNPGSRVTNARGGASNHNFGIAWDIGIFEGGKYVIAEAAYKSIAAALLPKLQNVVWGGNWKSFKDFPHYQLNALSPTVAGVKLLFENGKKYV